MILKYFIVILTKWSKKVESFKLDNFIKNCFQSNIEPIYRLTKWFYEGGRE